MRDQNLEQIIPMAQLCRELGVELRFIEYMDVGNVNQWKRAQVVPASEILQILSKAFEFSPGDTPKREKSLWLNRTATLMGYNLESSHR